MEAARHIYRRHCQVTVSKGWTLQWITDWQSRGSSLTHQGICYGCLTLSSTSNLAARLEALLLQPRSSAWSPPPLRQFWAAAVLLDRRFLVGAFFSFLSALWKYLPTVSWQLLFMWRSQLFVLFGFFGTGLSVFFLLLFVCGVGLTHEK